METGTEAEAEAGGAEASSPGSPVPAVPAGGPRADARTRDGAESGSGEQRQPPASSVDDGDGDGGLDNEAEEAARGTAVEAGDAARNSSSVRDGAGSGDERDPGSARAVTCDDATRAAPAVPEKRASPTADANVDADLDADLDADVDVDVDVDADAEDSSAAAHRGRGAACVERIMNEGEMGGGADVAESRRDRRKAREVQMVLDTSGASWNLKPGARVGGAPPAKRRRGDGAGGGAGGGGVAAEKGLSARGSLRARLRGFARTGSQVVFNDLEDEDEGEVGDSNAGASSHSEGRRKADMDVDPPETGARDADVAMDVDERQESPRDGASGDDLAKRPVIDLSHEPSADPKEPMDTSSSLVAETSTEASSAQANAALRTEVERVRSPAQDDVSLAFDLARVSGAWHGLRESLSQEKARAPHADSASAAPPTTEERVLRSKAGVQSTDDAGAGEALARVLHKEDFRTMSVVGQFNLGFIVARRRQRTAEREAGGAMDDLFIVDQHAADEKYNFETLQQTTRIESQRLFKCVFCYWSRRSCAVC